MGNVICNNLNVTFLEYRYTDKNTHTSLYTDYYSYGDITQLPTFIVTFSRLHLIVRGRQETRFCFDELPCRIDLLLRLLKQKRYKEKISHF